MALREGMTREDAQQVVGYAREITRAQAEERKRLVVGGTRTPAVRAGWDMLVCASGAVATEALTVAACTSVAESLNAEWQWANQLYRSARGAVAGRRPYDAAALLHKALRLLADHLDPAHVELRVRSLATLCWSEVETRGFAAGLVHLTAAEAAVAEIDDRVLRLELTSAVRGQRGVVLMRAGRFAESIAMLGQAVEIDEFVHAEGVQNHFALGTHLFNRGLALHAVGLATRAREDLRRCVDVVKCGQLDLAAESSRFACLAAEALHALGVLARREGDVPRALRYFEEARVNCRELPRNTWFRMKLDQAEALLAAGLAIQAGRHLDRALERAGRSCDDTIVAEAHALRSVVALAVGDREQARRQATVARRRFLRLGNLVSAALAGLAGLRAEVAGTLGHGGVPAGLVARARGLARELADLQLPDEAAVARLLVVRLEFSRGGNRADLPTLRQVTSTEGRVLLRLCRAEIAFVDGDRRTVLSQARAALAEFVQLHETSEPIDVDATSTGWSDVIELCGLALRVVALGSASEYTACRLFEWSERVRTRIRRGEPLLPADDPVLAQRIQEYRRLGRTLREARIGNRPWRELAARRRALRAEVLHAGRRVARAPVIAELDAIAAELGDRALVSYVPVGDEIVAVVVVEGRTRLVRLGTMATAFPAARELHADLAALSPDNLPAAVVDVVSRSARARARRLDTQLMSPLRDMVGDRELVVVPTGMLFAVAWGALPSLTGRPITVVPSATSWLAAARASAVAGRTVLVGGPGLSPAAVGEIGMLRHYRPDAWLLDGGQATTAIVLDALDGAGLVHLVAHGAHEPQNSLFSHLELADGAVYAHELARLRRPPEHLVLAACELAFSQGQLDCDALGFAGVLLDAGSRTVVTAVSQVGDESAAAAMADYHSRLAGGALPAGALAAAVAVDPLRRPFVCVGASG